MYADGEDPHELRGGHPPAAKVSGGMRIPRRDKRDRSGSEEHGVPKTEGTESSSEPASPPNQNNILAHTGLAAVTKRDFPEEAIRAYHDKPIPTKQDRNRPWAANSAKNQGPGTAKHIFQPRRFNTSGRKDLPHNSPNKIN